MPTRLETKIPVFEAKSVRPSNPAATSSRTARAIWPGDQDASGPYAGATACRRMTAVRKRSGPEPFELPCHVYG